jgi:hypothetical protein
MGSAELPAYSAPLENSRMERIELLSQFFAFLPGISLILFCAEKDRIPWLSYSKKTCFWEICPMGNWPA